MDPSWLTLLAKMGLSALIVVAASVVVERTGPFMGAMIATLPISAGPAYAYLAAEHGAAFIATSSLVSLSINAATIAFIVVYALLAQRRGVLASLGGAFAVWLGAGWLILGSDWTLAQALAANVLVFALALPTTRRYLAVPPAPPVARRWWDIPARAAAVMLLVLAVVLAGRVLGPRVAGIAALVPVALTSMALILHPRLGGRSTAAVMIHALPGMIGFTAAVACLHVAAVPLGAPAALGLALALCCAWNALLMVANGRLARRAGA